MKAAPTLIDQIVRATFKREPFPQCQSNELLRKRLLATRRFKLDDAMSAFIADLSMASFMGVKGKIAPRLADQLRISARLPHRSIWIEYNEHKCAARTNELIGRKSTLADLEAVPAMEGWLIEQHPQIETACRVHLFMQITAGEIYPMPFPYAWTTDDSPLPWRSAVPSVANMDIPADALSNSEVFVGVPGYRTDDVSIVASDLIKSGNNERAIQNVVKEWAGVLRRIWALLATLNDLPVKMTEVRASKGYVARGSYRKFLDHTTLTLHVPDRANKLRVARNLIAYVRRRGHLVRGHWREDWRNPGSRTCQHLWTVEQRCERCGGHRSWVHEHQRGDASRGMVTHDYRVTHEEAEHKL